MSVSNIIALLGLIVAVFGLVITIVKEWTYIALPFRKLKAWVKLKFALDMSKRKFLLSFGSVVGLLMFGLIGQLVYKFYNKNRAR